MKCLIQNSESPPMTTPNKLDLDKWKLDALNATQGEWLTREDLDYYQAGTYIGVGPYAYEKGNKVPGNEYFDTDIVRVENDDNQNHLLNMQPKNTLAMIDEITTLKAQVKELEGKLKDAIEVLKLYAERCDPIGLQAGECIERLGESE